MGITVSESGEFRQVSLRDYIAAVHAALSRDYAPMIEVFRAVIARTLRSVAKASSE